MPSATQEKRTHGNLTLPHPVVATLSPRPYLLLHLNPSDSSLPPTRPDGRDPTTFRPLTCHRGSLTHCNGSAVVRVGGTAVVCGIHAEILLAKSIPDPVPPTRNQSDTDLLAHLQLLVPNVELATGCSPAHLPGTGGPPSSEAQSLAHRLLALLHSSRLIDLKDLCILKQGPDVRVTETEDEDVETSDVVAYWTLYMSVYVLSLSGSSSIFDAAWAAVLGALGDVRLPQAWWDIDAENVVCNPNLSMAKRLELLSKPISCTWSVFIGTRRQNSAEAAQGNEEDFVNGKPRPLNSERQAWLLADPDGFEDPLCDEVIGLIVDCSGSAGHTRILSIEKHGGTVVSPKDLRLLLGAAQRRWKECVSALLAT